MLSYFYFFITLISFAWASPYDPRELDYNLNQNQSAVSPLDYWGSWDNHTFNPSPRNWRFPFYTFFLDRFANGDPTNDNANGTSFEQDIFSNQFRHGGDVSGLRDSLDYLQGLGIKGLYIAGSAFINQPWTADSFSPIDLTVLDHHYGTIQEWRDVIKEIHSRGMYVVLDNTFATMGDLVGFEGYLNDTTPFTLKEHKTVWKSDRRYLDFDIGNNYNETCQYPRFWNETGFPIEKSYTDQMKGCYNSDFDQYGDTEAFGVYPDFQRQLTKFASVQDRLREWVPSVRRRIQHFSCIAINMLDIDGFRFDKATQVTVDAQGEFGKHIRECARKLGKENFFMPGEITGGNSFASIYLGRGRQPDMLPANLSSAVALTSQSNDKYFIRENGKSALDAAAFHYTIYRSLTRFLGMDGNLKAGYDAPLNWVDAWNTMIMTNDLINANTGVFDPRHMHGVTNQDVFRWPAITNGTERMLLGLFITTIHLPGIPKLTWGEEQAFYVLDSTASNYIYGRQAMTSSVAWQMHGCYALGSTQYYQMPLNATRRGCEDDNVSLDHRDSSHPVHNIIKHMYYLREKYPVLNDGWFLQQLSNQTYEVQYPGSSGVETETGIWSVARGEFAGAQNLTGPSLVWLVYSNKNDSSTYTFDCSDKTKALIAAFDEGTTVKNLFYPHDEITLKSSPAALGFGGSTKNNGCIDRVDMKSYDFRAYVPKDQFIAPPPMITRFVPGHDMRLVSKVAPGNQEEIDIEIHFTAEMNCNNTASVLEINSSTEDRRIPQVDYGTIQCIKTDANGTDVPGYIGSIPTAWTFKAKLKNVSNGIHTVTVRNATTPDGAFTNSADKFMFRVGQLDNPMIFPRTANYTRALIHKNTENNTLWISHKAAGADKWRYSMNWGSSWSNWAEYHGGNNTLEEQAWSGTKKQEWEDEHIIAQYWSKLAGSSAVIQHADLGRENEPPRRFPHMFAHGPFNQYGFDAGLKNQLKLGSDGQWKFHFMSEWPDMFQLNVWGMNPDGQPDATGVYGDINEDGILDRLPPSSLSKLAINVTNVPPSPYLAYELHLNDGTYRYKLVPVGNIRHQLVLYISLLLVPMLSAILGVWLYMRAFYGVKFNETGVAIKFSLLWLPFFGNKKANDSDDDDMLTEVDATPATLMTDKRRCVLIATMEYDIEDWEIKIKIGGLGVMAQLMGKNLEHQDLIWVVPCVGGVEYPRDQTADSMDVNILGNSYEVQVQYHVLRNITYVLLDAPVFRKQTKSEPYPPRMDDMDSAIYYSAWNQCIAQTLERFPVDLYHINDYHGAAAPLYLLPKTIPCCLSLHNAEFQGLWPMRTVSECAEVCKVFNLPQKIVEEYVQFGSVFNLLHAGASYLRVHQRGVGAVGVSTKYGKRSWARYPIFWGLAKIGPLPNPDPTDTEAWNKKVLKDEDIQIDEAFEAARPGLKRQAQEWANLEQNPDAELFVFVGRWSTQKGVDLIADIFPSILEENPTAQLICVGPVIDLYGKFAALKLSKLMVKYPGRVFSKPEFTALPPYIFSGAEFALIPSRDEPFGLVAVEFGRKGALGVGARVGGLGQMPGWWYTVESTTTTHLLKQFRGAIESALASKQEVRRVMRARSAKQRFPVQQWKEDLGILQSKAIKNHDAEARKWRFWPQSTTSASRATSTIFGSRASSSRSTVDVNGIPMPRSRQGLPPSGLGRMLSLGRRKGPGHVDGDEDEECDFVDANAPARTDEYIIGEEEIEVIPRQFHEGRPVPAAPFADLSPPLQSPCHSPAVSISDSGFNFSTLTPPTPMYMQTASSRSSLLEIDVIVGDKTDFNLQKVDPFFTDSNGEFYGIFEKKLAGLNGKNSVSEMCIEEFIVQSEKQWFDRFRTAKLNWMPPSSSASSTIAPSRPNSRAGTTVTAEELNDKDEFLLGVDYKPPRGLKKYMQYKWGDWPFYSFVLAIGQIISANSYQVTLLTGGIGQQATKLYAIATVYLVTSCIWWLLFRRLKSVYVLSSPFVIYGIAFFILGMSPLAPTATGRFWVQNVATGLYAAASSSGSLFFALNFGDEGGAPVRDWVFRACVIQGTQQLYVTALWYWGSLLTSTSSATYKGYAAMVTSPKLAAVTVPLAVVMWILAGIIQFGLPDFYRQTPGSVPSFYTSLFRRKIVVWTFATVLIQNYFLSAPYGRNWQYLWSSKVAPTWAILLLVVLFFVVLWGVFLSIFAALSTHHSWILPIFAIGLGAPRWCQMLWSTSSIGLYLPWAGGPVSSALVGRTLWLWLGLLDTVQGVGFGMIFLQTLTRLHVTFTLLAAQVLGSIATILARATAPNAIGPGDVFPDFSAGIQQGLARPWFWVALLLQITICVGFFKFFRKEQLSKP
ncbi:uncharacterized protein BDR25DRAFT_378495 [Lindgomyces ingoldianus]|uniref:Uncharacterized protein n=1 Tax=Lindgomyces ingoldianus TaxID=673940 RepID=A0ACB6QGW9_9PLEO|nr:uncharacterized protein BDR25DRAFT_378495 [Lindgomyces ingoldianus]KAF2465803.1 hypothetical protein BDR25DRAFT_378495 [Lindgomyces ingoldianus]